MVVSSPYTADGRSFYKKARPGEPDYDRLFQAMRTCRRILKPYRDARLEAVKQYVGYHYSEGGSEQKVPVNLVAKYVQIIARSLVPNTPRVMLSTQKRESQPAVAAMQEWLNARLAATHFEKVIERWVVDALFSVGIMKVALGTPADSASTGYTAQVGTPFAACVDLDDFVFDVGARTFSEASYIGHRYRVPLEVAEKLDDFDKKARGELAGAATPDDHRINQDGDDRIGVVGTGWQGGEVRDYEPMVDLWEVYLPRTKRVVTFASDRGGVPNQSRRPLKNQEWVGPDCGPYHFLELMVVPGNAMPSAPIHHLIDLHEFINHGYRKLVNQMQRQKEVLPVRGGQFDDAKRLVQASDGEAFPCDNADTLKAVNYGGPNPVNAQFTTHLADVFNRQAGNLDLLSGAAPQSKTATQDKLLADNASSGVADMQVKTTRGIAGILEAHSWYWWYHPQQVMTSKKTLPGLPDIGVNRTLYPGQHVDPSGKSVMKRAGRFEDLMVRVDPYSLVYRSPQQRLQFLLTLFDKFSPAMPMLSSQGVQMDMQFFIKKIAEYADEPDVINFFTVSEPTQPPSGGSGGGPGMPANTSREYTRQSIGQDTEANRNAQFENDANEFAANQDGG